MPVYSNQFNPSKDLKPWYVLSGEESFLISEDKKKIIKYAYSLGYSEKISLYQEGEQFNESIANEYQSGSLFSQRKVLDIQLSKGKIDAQCAKILDALIDKTNSDNVVIISGALDSATQKQKWVKKIDTQGYWVRYYPLNSRSYRLWVMQKLANAGLQMQEPTLQLLLEMTEGNAFAAAQEIEKLAMVHQGAVSTQQLIDDGSDNAKYNIFNLTDYILAQDKAHAVRTLHLLKKEMQPVNMVIWQLQKVIQALVLLENNASVAKLGIWPNQLGKYKQLHSLFNQKQIQAISQFGAKLDQQLRGWNSEMNKFSHIRSAQTHVDIWQLVESVVLILCKQKSPALAGVQ